MIPTETSALPAEIQNEAPKLALKPVTHGDLKPFANARCKTCDGKGEFTKIVLGPIPKPPTIEKRSVYRVAKACGCALKRFMLQNRRRVTVEKGGALMWLPEAVVQALAERAAQIKPDEKKGP